MEAINDAPGYHIWGIDNTSYGPVELPTLVNWIKDDRVLAHTWIFVERDGAWQLAADVSELNIFFKPKRVSAVPRTTTELGQSVQPGALRRIKALAEMSDEQLAVLIKYIETLEVRGCTHLIKRGDPGDAIYGVFEGEFRSCLVLDGKECPVSTLAPGSIFGEISFFDKGPHAVDVISNQESLLLKISAESFARLCQEAPQAALALSDGLIKAIAGRVRTLTRRYETSVQIGHHAEEIKAA